MGSKKKASRPASKKFLEALRKPRPKAKRVIPISHEVPDDAPEQKGSLTLAIGRRYYRRDGAITGPLEDVLTEPLYDFFDPEHAELYTSKARGYSPGSTGHHKSDLVAECKAEEQDKYKGLFRLTKDVLSFPDDVESIDCGSTDTSHLLIEVLRELNGAMTKFPSFNSLHEAMSVLREEVDELWEEVRKKQVLRAREEESEGDKFVPNLERTRAARREAIQVIAMAMRLVLDNCTKGKPGYGK